MSGYTEARDRLLRGEGLGVKGYMESMFRHQGQLPPRRSPQDLQKAADHFATHKHRLSTLEQENNDLRAQLTSLQTLATTASSTLKKQREALDSFYSKAESENVSPATRSDSGLVTSGLHLQSATGP
jgi:hypothetical protein